MHTTNHTPRNIAFSLVELSIVLVILGLLVGGILAGQSLIRAAELRSIGTQYQSYVTATLAFRDKYFALPGDMTNATSFWGIAHATTCRTTQGTGTATCNGDGNGVIVESAGTEYGGTNEAFRYWQHLANAGLIEGTYTGIGGPGDARYHAVVGTNVPRGRIGNVGWMMDNRNYTTDAFIPYQTPANRFWVGREHPGSEWTTMPFLKPEELWNIDTKLDDGMPIRGNVRAVWYVQCTNATAANDFDAAYALTTGGMVCAMTFENKGSF